MFDDFESSKLLDYNHAADSAAIYLKHAQHIELQMDSLRIIFSGKSAIAIFFVNQKLMSGGKWYVLRSRATVALLRKRSSWFIFHEHWSLVGDDRAGLPGSLSY